MKKGLLFISICAICVILGQIGRMSFGNVGLADVKNLEDLKKVSFYFDYAEGKSDAENYEGKIGTEYVNSALNREYIFIAKPTGNIKVGGLDVMQEVKIEKVIRGKSGIESDTVWVDGMPGFECHDDRIYLDAFSGWMMKNQRYLICASSYHKGLYEAEKWFGCLNLETSDSGMVVDTEQEYTYEEICQAQFFAGDESVLKAKQNIKERILEELELNK